MARTLDIQAAARDHERRPHARDIREPRLTGTPRRGRRSVAGAGLACVSVGCVLAAPLFVPDTCPGASPPLVELRVDGKAHRGRIVAENSARCWLQSRDGRLDQFSVRRIESQKVVGPSFRGATTVEMRDELKREVGQSYQVVATDHYVVCAPKGATDRYAPLFEDVYRSVQRYFSVRGFTMKKPEFPLVAVVFPDRNRFLEQCKADRVSSTVGLQGYYHPATNRVALFDPAENATSAVDNDEPFAPARVASRGTTSNDTLPWNADQGPFAGAASARASLRDTIIHETTHQVAYNTGLHTRLGDTPHWVIEGLATVFEAPGIRDGGAKQTPLAQRINRERYLRFGSYAKSRRPAKSLKAFLESDDMMHDAMLDFYAQAWGLTFFLVETRPAAYARYLKRVSERDPLAAYPPKQRVADFEEAFDTTVERLEVDFLRMMERLKVE